LKSIIGGIFAIWVIGALVWGARAEWKEHRECTAANGMFACPTQGGPGPLLRGAMWPIDLYQFAVAGAKSPSKSSAAKSVAPQQTAVIDKVEPGWVAPLANDVPLVLALLASSSEDRVPDRQAISRLSRRFAEGRTESLPKLELAGSTYVAFQVSLMNDAIRFVEYLSQGTVPSVETSLSSRSLALEKALDEFPQAAAFMHKDNKGAIERFSVLVAPFVERQSAIEAHPDVVDTLRGGFRESARMLTARYKEIFGKAPEKIEGNFLN
jgi:hypothetical protein